MMEYTIPSPDPWQPTPPALVHPNSHHSHYSAYGIHLPNFTGLVQLSDPARVKNHDAKLWRHELEAYRHSR